MEFAGCARIPSPIRRVQMNNHQVVAELHLDEVPIGYKEQQQLGISQEGYQYHPNCEVQVRGFLQEYIHLPERLQIACCPLAPQVSL